MRNPSPFSPAGPPDRGLSPAVSATILICAYFILSGMHTVYFPAWLEDARGFSPAEIGAIMGVATLVRVVSGPFVAAWSEITGFRLALLTMAGLGVAAGLGLVPAGGVLTVAALAIALQVAMSALGPLTEALLMRATQKARRLNFGIARGLGSLAFSLGTILGGVLIARAGADAILPGLILASVGILAAVFLVRGEPRRVTLGRANPLRNLAEGAMLFRARRLALISAAVALTQAGHAQYYNFSTIIWLGQGIDGDLIGPLWTIGVVAEVILLATATRLFRGWAPEGLVLLGAGGAVVRWSVLGTAPGLGVIVVVQTLHALSFAATHLGMLRAVLSAVPERKVPLALAIYSSFAFGPVLALAAWVCGLIVEAGKPLGPVGEARAYFLMSALCAAGGAIALYALLTRGRSQPPQKDAAGGETMPFA